MCRGFIERAFPGLAGSHWQIASPRSWLYNCIAWAAGDIERCWWPDPQDDYYWPPGAPRSETVEAFVVAYGELGYSVCHTPELERGYEKIAIYARANKPTHAARQLADGHWTSKLGRAEDVEHDLQGLQGAEYGTVAAVLRRESRTPDARTR